MYVSHASESDLFQQLHRSHPFVARDWERFKTQLRSFSLPAGEYLVKKGDRVDSMYWVHRGFVRSFLRNARGKEFTRDFIAPGEFCADFSALWTNSSASHHLQAVTDADLVEIPYRDFEAFAKDQTDWMRLYLDLAKACYMRHEKREAGLLELSPAERYRAFTREQPDILNRIPQYQVASYLGINPVSLSRIRARIAKKKAH